MYICGDGRRYIESQHPEPRWMVLIGLAEYVECLVVRDAVLKAWITRSRQSPYCRHINSRIQLTDFATRNGSRQTNSLQRSIRNTGRHKKQISDRCVVEQYIQIPSNIVSLTSCSTRVFNWNFLSICASQQIHQNAHTLIGTQYHRRQVHGPCPCWYFKISARQ